VNVSDQNRTSAGGPGSARSAEPLSAEVVHETERTRVVRLLLPGRAVIQKQPLGPDAERRLGHELAMLERLRGVVGVAQLVDAPRYPGSVVLEDVGGMSLAEVAEPLAVDELIGLAVALARAVSGMHQRGVMHRDITPANVLIGRDGKPCLVDFALAMSLAELRPAFTHHTEIIGTLAYLAPEQTGRTGRSVDQRADLYALGATLYELATGAPPFGSGDPLRLTHDLLAQVPAAPDEVNPKVPVPLSGIVMHLLEKEPDSRYQSAEGVVYDLERLRDAQARPAAAALRIGEHDVPLRLLPPSRLVGRDDEIAALQAAFADALRGACRGVLVSGAPGVGKTALLDELRPAVTERNGWFVAGKFDQHRRDLEFDAVNQAFRALGGQLLAEPEDELTDVRQRILNAVGTNAGLLTAAVPEFAALLGTGPEPGDPLTADVRAQRTALDVLRAVAAPKRPVVLFLDDLQWAGRTPLGVVDLVLSEEPIHGLLLVGTYRDSGVDAPHPLAASLSQWREQAGVRFLRLENLSESGSVALVAQMLRVRAATAAGLARAAYPHTSGNPYETIELLGALRRDDVLSATADGWRWDAAAVRAHLCRPAVNGMVTTRIDAMPANSRNIVEAMACLGGRAELSLLETATGMSEGVVAQALAPAVDEGLLVAEPGPREAVRFRHDQTREEILGGLDPRRRPALQLAMARRLADVPELFAAAAEQYLPVLDAVDDAAERRQVVGVLRRAADQAALTGDTVLVNKLLTAAMRLIDPGERATLIDVHTGRHAALFSAGRLDEADEEYREIERLSAAALERADATAVQTRSLTHRNRYAEAIGLGLGSLRQLGIAVPAVDQLSPELERRFDYLYRWLDHTDGADDLARPDITDPVLLAAARVLNAILPAAYFVEPSMQAWLSLEAFRIWLEHGPTRTLVGTAGVAAFHAVALRGDAAGGYRAVRRILSLGVARGYEPDTAQVRSLFAVLSCWFEPIENGVQPAQRAREELIAGGDPANAGYTYYPTVYYLLDCGSSLDSCVAEVEAGLAFVRRTGIEQTGESLESYRWLTSVLRGERSAAASEANPLERYAHNPLALLHAHVNHAIAAAVFGDPVGLGRHAAGAMSLLPVAPGLYAIAVARLLQGLALAEHARARHRDERSGLLAELDEVTEWLAARAADAPANFRHLLLLLEAERAWAVGDFRAAVLAFDSARREVAVRQRPWHRALITERTARFYLAHGIEQAGYELLAQAREEYLAWGATAKVAQLDWAYPTLQEQRDVSAADGGQAGDLPRGRSAVTSGTIDLLGVLSASQALSSETTIERLHSRVIEVLSAMTGATGIHLVLWSEERQVWRLPARSGDAGTVLASGEDDGLVPLSVLRYARRTGEPLVVSDATRDDRFARDPYFTDVDRCSLLALPILGPESVQALLVLENRLIRGAFSTQRLDAVNLIAGQLAVSLRNAQLYAEFRQVADEQAALRRVATLVAEGAPPTAVFDAVAAEVGRLLAADDAAVWRYLPDGAGEIVSAWSRKGEAIPVGYRAQPVAGTLTGTVKDTGQAARVDRYSDEAGGAAREIGIRSSVGAPIILERELWGLVAVVSTGEEPPPPGTEERLAGFTELVATAIANAQAREELRMIADEQAALGRVATLVAQGEGPADVFAAVAEEVGHLLNTDDALVVRFEPDESVTIVASWTAASEPLPVGHRRHIARNDGVTPVVRETGRPARIDSKTSYYSELGIESAVAAPITVEGRIWGVVGVALRGPNPAPPDTEERLAAFTGLVATAIANAQARIELRRYAEEQAALRRVATLVAQAVPPEEVFASVTEEVGRVLDVDYTETSRYESDRARSVVGAWARSGTPVVPVGTSERGGADVPSLVFESDQPARIHHSGGSAAPAVAAVVAAGIRTSVGVPIRVEGRLWGVMSVHSKSADPLPADTEDRLARFTALIATAIANAESQSALTASRARIVAAADGARRRIERDLHDGAQQRLVTLALRLRAAQAAMPPDLAAQLDTFAVGLNGALDELLELARGIHPPVLAAGGLGPALKALARRSAVPVEVALRTAGRLPEPVEIAAYYVVSEALTNAIKHAHATAITLTAEADADDHVLRVAVCDDGVGGADVTRGTGLVGLKDRVEALSGRILLDSPPGAGTRLRAELPIPATKDSVTSR